MSQKPNKQDLTETSPMATDPSKSGPLPIDDLVSGNGPASTGGLGNPSGASAAGSRAGDAGGAGGAEPNLGRARTKGGTNVDTIIGKIVVDQGLATSEEVQACFEQSRSLVAENNQRSLADLLVTNEYITKRQLERIRRQAEAERSGQQIPGYKILGKLGAGAMATVFKARQLSLDRMVAIKVLPRKFSSNSQFIERFYAEGKSAAQLNHPNIVQAYDVGQAGDYHYFVMEYVEGRTVYDDIIKHKRYSEPDAIDIVIQIAEALQHAHAKGLIHRDVKPKNIMMTQEGVAKLADMGLARAISDKEAAEAEQGKAFGTPYYISPEQIRGEMKIGPPADIYSLGATLYHMVTGSVPFDGKSPSAVMHKHLKADIVAPDHVNPKLSAGISEVIEMMMAKDPRARYQNCGDLLVDLRSVRAGKTPALAHKDLAVLDMASVIQAEAAAPAQLAEDRSDATTRKGSKLFEILFYVMLGLFVVSVVLNIWLLSLRGG